MRAALVALAACSPVGGGPAFDLPSDIEWAGAVAYEGDRLVSGTPLAQVGAEPLRITAPARFDRIVVIGYRSEDLAGFTVDASPLIAGSEGDPLIPTPSYAAAAGPSDAQGTPLIDPVELTASWVDACTDPPPFDVQIGCALTNCEVGRMRRGCTLDLEPAACMTGTFEVQLAPDGRIVRAGSQQYGACTATAAPEGADRAFRCQSADGECTVEFLPTDPPPAFSVERIALYSGEPLRFATYFGSVVVIDDVALVSDFGGVPQDRYCTSSIGRLHRIDLTGTAPPAQSEAAPCLMHMTPWSGGFVGTFGAGERSLGWFDREGALLRSTPLPGLIGMRGVAVVGDRAYVLGEPNPNSTIIASVDLVTGALERSIPIARFNQVTVVFGSGRLMIADDEGDLARFIDPTTLEEVGSLALSDFAPFSVEVKTVVADPSSDRFLALIGSTFAGITSFEPERLAGRIVSFDADLEPTAAVLWPSDPSRMLTALMDRRGGPPIFKLLDPKRQRYLPGALTVDGIEQVQAMAAGSEAIIGLIAGGPDLVIVRPQ